SRDSEGISVAAAALSGYRSAVQHAVIAALGRRLGVPIGRRARERVMAIAATGRSGSRVPVGRGMAAEVAFGRLTLRRLVPPFAPLHLDGPGNFRAGGFGLTLVPGLAPEAL